MKSIVTLVFLAYTSLTAFADFGQEWVARYNGTGNSVDWSSALITDGSGNVYVTGYVTNVTTGKDLFVIKYNTDGVPLWTATYNGPVNGGDYSFAIALDNSANVYITGRSDRGATSSDYTTIKYNSNGVQQWVPLYEGQSHSVDEARAICVDGSGNVYVTGKSVTTSNGLNIVTIKYNSAGAVFWVHTFNGAANSDDIGSALGVDNAGNVFVCGATIGAGFDYVTLRINPDGTQAWAKTYNGPVSGGDAAVAICI